MHDDIAIGVDVGGSHIVSALVDLKELRILPGTLHDVKVDSNASKDTVFETWSIALNRTMAHISKEQQVNLGFAIPGRFDYANGIGLYQGDNVKYTSLKGVSIPKELPKYLDREKVAFRFHNDATAFGVGVAVQENARVYEKTIVVTLGTGFGCAFVKKGIPLVTHSQVPQDGCLWNKPFKEGIGDDYFSTRWCIQRYEALSAERVKGVKEVAEAHNAHSQKVFEEFGANMAEFMIPYLQKFRPDLLVLGGNISKASALFLPTLKDEIKKSGIDVHFQVSPLMEDAAILGSALLFDPGFWAQVKNDLPTL